MTAPAASPAANPMDRRDFLSPSRLATSAGQVLALIGDLESPEPLHDQEASLLRLAWRAMATTFEIIVSYGTPNAVPLAEQAFAYLDTLESQLTVYRDSSEISQLNRMAGHVAVRVEPGLFALLRLAKQIHAESEGAFDISAGALIKAWGFFKGPRRVPPPEELAQVRERVGMAHVELNEAESSIRFLRPRMEINLGSIGKGYALDRLNGFIGERGALPSMLLHGGYSSVYAKGVSPGDARGWPIVIRHPWEPARKLATVWLRDAALGTSAATWQHLEYNGKKLGHVLDPRTGWPASGIASCSVVAPSGAEADALSTAFFVGGLDLARKYIASHPNVGAILLPEGDLEPVVLGLGPKECSLIKAPAADHEPRNLE